MSSIGSSIGGAVGNFFGSGGGSSSVSSFGGMLGNLGSSIGSLFSGSGPTLATLGTSALSGGLTYQGIQDMNRTNLELVEQQNQAAMERQKDTQSWEANMANTAEQRQVADLKAAGLNPMLAVHGAGAAVPNVSSPPVAAGQVQNALGGAVGSAISSAGAVQDLRLKAAQVENQEAQTSATLAQARKSNTDADSAALDLASKQFFYGNPSSRYGSGFQADWLQRLAGVSQSSDNAIKAQFDARNADLQGQVLSRERQSRDYSLVSEKAAADVSSSLVGRQVLPWLERISPMFTGTARGARDLGTIFGK